jgi:hypothetical protein
MRRRERIAWRRTVSGILVYMRNDEFTDARSALLVGADKRDDAKHAQEDLLAVIFADDTDVSPLPAVLALFFEKKIHFRAPKSTELHVLLCISF